jgi:hypothetical protein
MYDFDWTPADEAAFELDMANLGFTLGDNGTLSTVLVGPDGKEHVFADRQDAHAYLQTWYPGFDEDEYPTEKNSPAGW